jgi:hypothetical protein
VANDGDASLRVIGTPEVHGYRSAFCARRITEIEKAAQAFWTSGASRILQGRMRDLIGMY